MSLFTKLPEAGTGIYTLFDPAAPKKSFRFSPPFFSPSDDLAKNAVLETLISKFKSLEDLKSSSFLDFELWYVGAFEFTDGSLLSGSRFKRRCVCKLRDYVLLPEVLRFLSSSIFGTAVKNTERS